MSDDANATMLRSYVLALAASAGFVVVAVFLEVDHVEVGAMTGNTVASGAQLGTRGTAATLTRLFPIPAFVLGVVAGVVLAERVRACARVPALTRVLACEIALLVTYMVVEGWPRPTSHVVTNLLLTLPAFALGLQTATVRRVDGRTVRTTFMTGMLSRFGEEAGHWLLDHRSAEVSRLCFLAGIWSMYLLGAVAGGFADARWRLWSLGIPIAVLAVVAGIEALRAARDRSV